MFSALLGSDIIRIPIPRKPAMSKTNLNLQPPKMTLAYYAGRVVRIRGEARGKRSMVEWVDAKGEMKCSAVKWKNLQVLGRQLF